MYELFTDTVRSIMVTANSHAGQFHHDYVGCLHMLIGVLDVAPGAFQSTSVDVIRMRELAVNKLKHSESVGGKAAIESSLEQARLHNSSTVDVSHFLIGILSRPDDAVRCVFDALQLDMDAVRRQLSDDLGTP